MSGHSIRVAGIYADPQPGEGKCVLVGGLWPRGVRTQRAAQVLRDVLTGQPD